MRFLVEDALIAIWLIVIIFIVTAVGWLVRWIPGWLFAAFAVVCVVVAFYLLGVINEQQKVIP